jgi:hypothetical protein
MLLAIWAFSYVLSRRIPILLLNKGEAAVFQMPILLKALFVGSKLKLTFTFMKVSLIIGLIAFIVGLFSCKTKPKENSDKELFEKVLNDSRVNSKEVGEREGIEYFQVMENGKTGFRDLDGNIVIKPIYDNAEMFSEGFSTVSIGKQYGLIDEKGNYVLPLRDMGYLGSVHNGLASFRANDKYGFIDVKGRQIIKPQFDWVSDFSEGLCSVRNDKGKIGSGKYGYIDTTGKIVVDLKFQYANDFENGQAKFEQNNLWGAIDKTGKIVIEPTHQYTSGW